MKSILVPTDFSNEADNALQVASILAKKTNRSIDLLHVIPDFSTYAIDTTPFIGYETMMGEYIRKMNDKSSVELSKRSKAPFLEGAMIHSTSLKGIPKETIVRYSKEHHSSIVVMGTKGASGFEESVLGSNAEMVVRKATCPVLVINKEVKEVHFEHVLWISDFGDEASNLVPEVLDITQALGSHIHLCRINTPIYFRSTDEVIDSMNSFASNWNIIPASTFQYDDMDFESGVAKAAKSVKADLIVIGTHGRNAVSQILFESLAEELVNHLTIPILTYPL